mmetsp:Transcript_43119/g.103950  ORF Transcript_43119/g.103950 Transcript_43119/m.103950 type:complete len:330 (-) Transcript_43119:554-1543(-)
MPVLAQLLGQLLEVSPPLLLHLLDNLCCRSACRHSLPQPLDRQRGPEPPHRIPESPPAQVPTIHGLQAQGRYNVLVRSLVAPPRKLDKLQNLVQVDEAVDHVIDSRRPEVDLGQQRDLVAVDVRDRHGVLREEVLQAVDDILDGPPRRSVLPTVGLELGSVGEGSAPSDDELMQRELVEELVVVPGAPRAVWASCPCRTGEVGIDVDRCGLNHRDWDAAVRLGVRAVRTVGVGGVPHRVCCPCPRLVEVEGVGASDDVHFDSRQVEPQRVSVGLLLHKLLRPRVHLNLPAEDGGGHLDKRWCEVHVLGNETPVHQVFHPSADILLCQLR